MILKQFPFYRQVDTMDCGPACLKMIYKFYGKSISMNKCRELCKVDKTGSNFHSIGAAAEKLGFDIEKLRISFEDIDRASLPAIIHWKAKHFVVLYKIKNGIFFIADPAKGKFRYNSDEFLKYWAYDPTQKEGSALLLRPNHTLYEIAEDRSNKLDFKYLWRYLKSYKKLILQLVLGLIIGSFLQLVAPLLTQSIVDFGIKPKNINFIYVVLAAQATLVVARTINDFLRSWILLHISIRVNVSIITDFLKKLMDLPIGFFEKKKPGDIMQRIVDQKRLEGFLTGTALNTIFSIFNFVIFGAVLLFYNFFIFSVFLASSLLYSLWILLFLSKRREIDYKLFDVGSRNQSNLIQMINGITEIKLNGWEKKRRKEWEDIQSDFFDTSSQSLQIAQIQQSGVTLLNEGKNVIITFLSAMSVVNGDLSLGAMFAIQYIIGQLNAPIDQLVGFIKSVQDVKLSLERINEIHEIKSEKDMSGSEEEDLQIADDESIKIQNLTFSYDVETNSPVLQDITFNIQSGKTTAIVGLSGSGKTTILKLLLKFYDYDNGSISIGGKELKTLNHRGWRQNCGIVLQDGYIFSDTIANNIAVGDDVPDTQLVLQSIATANLESFVHSLPAGIHTLIGPDGHGLSQGQRQRLLIARAIYKNPKFIFFDEATNALDSTTEKTIMQNLNVFFKDKTVLIVAHRLSTIKNANKIIVLENGQVIEQGTHRELIESQGAYYRLVQDQLDN